MAWSNDWVNPFRGVRVISNNWFEVKSWFKEDFWDWDGNVKFRKGPKEVFEFLRCLMELRFLNDPNRFTLDFMLANYVWSLIINVYLEIL